MRQAAQGALAFAPPERSLLLSRLQAYFQAHARGADNAVVYAKLAKLLRVHRSVVHELVAELVVRRRLPVGTCSSGAYWIVSRADANIALAYLRPRAEKIWNRWKALRQTIAGIEYPQGTIEERDDAGINETEAGAPAGAREDLPGGA